MADDYVNTHEGLECDSDTRSALRALAERLARENPPKTILTCVQRVSTQVRPNKFEMFYKVTDPASLEVVMEIPDRRISQEVFVDWLLLQVGNTCASCLEFLIDGEEGICGLCESREIMELLRLRSRLT